MTARSISLLGRILLLAVRGTAGAGAYRARASVPAIFLPRDTVGAAAAPLAAALRGDLGAAQPESNRRPSAIAVGNTVTMPKEYMRLAGTRATGRSFDDRVGCTALLLAVRRLDPARLKHRVIFVWSVREEIGLEGAQAVANRWACRPRGFTRSTPSSRPISPLEPKNFGARATGHRAGGPGARQQLDHAAGLCGFAGHAGRGPASRSRSAPPMAGTMVPCLRRGACPMSPSGGRCATPTHRSK